MTYKELTEKYPEILGELPYFSCGVGWINIIDELCEKLRAYVKKSHLLSAIKAGQVKEKFAGLRFYVDYIYISPDDTDTMTKRVVWNRVQDIISKAEAKSFKTCEVCGEPGDRDPTSQYWMMTRCKKHYRENEIRDYKTGQVTFKSE